MLASKEDTVPFFQLLFLLGSRMGPGRTRRRTKRWCWGESGKVSVMDGRGVHEFVVTGGGQLYGERAAAPLSGAWEFLCYCGDACLSIIYL